MMNAVAANQAFASIRVVGGLLPTDLLARIADGKDISGSKPTDYHVVGVRSVQDEAERHWDYLKGAWRTLRAALGDDGHDPAGLATENWLLPLFEEHGFGRLQRLPAGIPAIDHAPAFPVSHRWEHVPVHLAAWDADLDRRPTGGGLPPQSMLQECLNRSPAHLWGILANGRHLRILRDSTSLTGSSYIDIDLEAMFDGELFAEFVVLYRLLHVSRYEIPDDAAPSACRMERWRTEAIEAGARALDQLRDGVQHAIAHLGTGLLRHPANSRLREDLDADLFKRALLRLVYRLLFWFVAEDRDILLTPGTDGNTRSRYEKYFSSRRLRATALRRTGSTHGDLWRVVQLILRGIGDENGLPKLGLPGLGGIYDDTGTDQILHGLELSNEHLLGAIRSLARVHDPSTRRYRPVDYRNLGAEELGSIYESLLELVPKWSKGERRFLLDVMPGNERKSTGSYYTPTSLIDCLLDSALNPVLDDTQKRADMEARAAETDPAIAIANALLSVKVCDPACGSGHFLVAAARRIAKRLAAVREHNPEPTVEALRVAMRDVVAHCIYGVDVNPMAVELAKVSLWMEAVEPGKPLSFLDHHVLCGNSLLGTTLELLEAGIPDEAFTALEDDDRRVVTELKKRNHQEHKGQQLLTLGYDLNELESVIAADALRLDQRPDHSASAVHEKEKAFRDLIASSAHERAKLIADTWCAAFVAPKRVGKASLTEGVIKLIASGSAGQNATLQVQALAAEYQFLHWELAFPTVFHRRLDDSAAGLDVVTRGGFDVIVGNPPFVNAIEGGVAERSKGLIRFINQHVGGTADLAYYFLAASTRVVRPGGRIGLVQPRAMLNAPAARAMRAQLVSSLRPNLLYAPDRSDLFHGPAVFITLVVLGPARECRVSRDNDLATATWVTGTIETDNWWGEIGRLLRGGKLERRAGSTVADMFTVGASMTTADAYDVIPYVVDDADDFSPKLVTTGLIEPNQCLWGEINCRYLKRDYRYPRVLDSAALTRSLRRRIDQARRPKILVAGLSKRIECFVDRKGEYIGAVSTFSIYHPSDDVAELEALCEELLSDDFTDRFVDELGGNAMGGGNTTMKKSFLAALPYSTHVEG